MLSWLITSVGLCLAWIYTDLESESSLYSTVCPILVGVFLMTLAVKIVLLLGPENAKGDGGSFGGSGGFGSGDGGCGGDGGGC